MLYVHPSTTYVNPILYHVHPIHALTVDIRIWVVLGKVRMYVCRYSKFSLTCRTYVPTYVYTYIHTYVIQ